MRQRRQIASHVFLAVALLCTLLASNASAAEAVPPKKVSRFLSQHCLACHGAKKQSGKHRFDTLGPDFSQAATARTWRAILDQLTTGKMPPRKRPRPDPAALREMTRWITGRLEAFDGLKAERNDAVRRLNRREYNNTLRDLLLIDTSYDPAAGFPADDTAEGFDTVGAALVFSPALLREALRASADAIDRAVKFGPQPKVRVYRILPREATRPVYRTDEYVKIVTATGDGFQQFRPGSKDAPRLAQGEYLIRVHATALHSDFKGVGAIDGPVRVLIRVGPPGKTAEAGSRRTIGTFDVPDNQPQTFTVRARFEAGQVPIVSFPNGHRGSFKNLVKKRFGREARQNRAPIMANYDGPQLRVFWMEVEGPLYDRWPLPGHEKIFGRRVASEDHHYVEQTLENFTTRAFRRPVTSTEVQPFLALYDRLRDRGDTFEQAIKSSLQAVLCSPGFLYLRTRGGPLDEFAIANRLSYFLWSSMPDAELLELAAKGQLHRGTVRAAQMTRLLGDPRCEAFVNNFTGQWLGLDQLGSMPPDPKRFRNYYRGNLETAMREETRRFFSHILKHDLDVAHFLDADFTFLNQRLAQHYGIKNVEGSEFRRVPLDPAENRGGVLGHASVLTLTSNGTVTSPVVRGVWILNNLMGESAAPPPQGVPDLEPDTRGATTIREQLAKHRTNAGCLGCHQKIDPLGFALEHFDPTGQWRPRYDNRRPIDTSGTLENGQPLDGILDLKKLLLKDRDRFLGCLVEKLLVYATGAPVAAADRPGIDKLIGLARQRDGKFQELIRLVVASDRFIAPAATGENPRRAGTAGRTRPTTPDSQRDDK